MSKNNFYRAFEDRHRGSRELIKSRLNVYRPFIEPLILEGQQFYAVDLGCGRGEWLEILGELGISALGIDIDEGMLRACSERGLKTILGDAIAYLSKLDDESQLIVSAFHVIEHIEFDQIQTLVQEAHRVLSPGGLLIMETPNPENILVATCNFYLDPTHRRPIPPELLVFMTDFYQFSRSKILRLQQGDEIMTSNALNLNDILGGVSPDYAVVAQKQAPDYIQSRCDQAFSPTYGINLSTLASKYSTNLDQRINQAELKAQQAELLAASILTSYSWRITGPLRWTVNQFHKIKQEGLLLRLKKLVKKVRLNISNSQIDQRKVKSMTIPKNYDELPPQAKQIYTKLISTKRRSNADFD